MFFSPLKEAPALMPERLRGLRISLNTPVVRTDDLPAAPARAVLVLHEAESGQPAVLIGVRSLKSGEVLHFAPAEALAPGDDGLDAAMAFGEGMGFLFDEDELEGGDAERAYAMWQDLMAAPPVLDTSLPPLGTSASGDSLLLLDEERAAPGLPPAEVVSPPNASLLTDLVEDALAPAGEAGGEAPPPSLTKFRTFEPAPAGPELELASPGDTGSFDLSDPGLSGSFDPVEATSDFAVDPEAGPELELAERGETTGDLVTGEPEADAEPDAPAPAEAEPETEAPEAAPAPPEPAPTKASTKKRRAALGRLRLVKRRKSDSDEDRRTFLSRLLSAF